jgi:ABC-type transport system substrate-binding protein
MSAQAFLSLPARSLPPLGYEATAKMLPSSPAARLYLMLRKLSSALIPIALLLTAAASFPTFEQTLRIAMTASDTPTTGIPNNGGEGFRFLGFPAFDGLINWDFTRPDQTAGLTPGLAVSWKIDESDHTH